MLEGVTVTKRTVQNLEKLVSYGVRKVTLTVVELSNGWRVTRNECCEWDTHHTVERELTAAEAAQINWWMFNSISQREGEPMVATLSDECDEFKAAVAVAFPAAK